MKIIFDLFSLVPTWGQFHQRIFAQLLLLLLRERWQELYLQFYSQPFFGSRYTNNVKFIFIGTPRRLNKSKDQRTVRVGCTPRTLSCYPRWALLSLITQSNWNKILYTDRRSELRLKPKLPVVCWEGLRLK